MPGSRGEWWLLRALVLADARGADATAANATAIAEGTHAAAAANAPTHSSSWAITGASRMHQL